jgi:transposase
LPQDDKEVLHAPVEALLKLKPRKTKLDGFKALIRAFMKRNPKASAAVIAERFRPLEFTDRLSILRNYLRTLRDIVRVLRAFIRVKSNLVHGFEVDYGHFGLLNYRGDKRNLYALCLTECHRRRLYVEFTHRQSLHDFSDSPVVSPGGQYGPKALASTFAKP